MRSRLNQKGFAAIEGVLILIIVAIIGGTGYFVYKAQNKTNTALDQAISTSDKTADTTKATSVYKFKELGVEFKLPDSLKGMTYEVKQLPDEQTGQKMPVLYLADPHLKALAKKCAGTNADPYEGQNPNFAAIDKFAGNYDANKEVGESSLLKQFATFHILVGYPNGSICGSDDDNLNKEWSDALGKSQQAFVEAFQASAVESE